ncbi:hypothetical protein MycrhDRAFT_2717 [Mycolicibacterium rhodesiae JS60]|nr:hypothetical protein MycrhDRAFT_2717 [Mycolicibacterium rhodesiae JS60]
MTIRTSAPERAEIGSAVPQLVDSFGGADHYQHEVDGSGQGPSELGAATGLKSLDAAVSTLAATASPTNTGWRLTTGSSASSTRFRSRKR